MHVELFLPLSLNKCLSNKTDSEVPIFLSYFLFKFSDLMKKKKVKRDFFAMAPVKPVQKSSNYIIKSIITNFSSPKI